LTDTDTPLLRFDIFTLFPPMFEGPFGESIIKRARENGLISVHLHNIRDYAPDRHAVTDDTPYGGGGGMVMKAPPIFFAVEAVLGLPPRGADEPRPEPPCPIILMTPQGRPFTQRVAEELAAYPRLALLCGRYEGVDERVMPYLDGELSLGDFILTGGEIAALAVVDAVARLLPGVLGNQASHVSESFEEGLLEHPQYTRPPVFRGAEVPVVLQSGDHGRIARWRRWKALKLTEERRPDLFARLELSPADRKLLGKREEEL